MASSGDSAGPLGVVPRGVGEENSFRIFSVAGGRGREERGRVSLPGVNTSRSTIGVGFETRFLFTLGAGNCCISSCIRHHSPGIGGIPTSETVLARDAGPSAFLFFPFSTGFLPSPSADLTGFFPPYQLVTLTKKNCIPQHPIYR